MFDDDERRDRSGGNLSSYVSPGRCVAAWGSTYRSVEVFDAQTLDPLDNSNPRRRKRYEGLNRLFHRNNSSNSFSG